MIGSKTPMLDFITNGLVKALILFIFIYVIIELGWRIVKRFIKLRNEVKNENCDNSKNS